MTPDPELVLETKAWFKKAAHDLRIPVIWMNPMLKKQKKP